MGSLRTIKSQGRKPAQPAPNPASSAVKDPQFFDYFNTVEQHWRRFELRIDQQTEILVKIEPIERKGLFARFKTQNYCIKAHLALGGRSYGATGVSLTDKRMILDSLSCLQAIMDIRREHFAVSTRYWALALQFPRNWELDEPILHNLIQLDFWALMQKAEEAS